MSFADNISQEAPNAEDFRKINTIHAILYFCK